MKDQTYTEDQVDRIAQDILETIAVSDAGATVLALQGDLGAGKTTLAKALAKRLGVTETVVSPTFVIAKFYDANKGFNHMIHIDAYRIESNDELVPLGWEQLLQQPGTLIIVEWPERIIGALPDAAQRFAIIHDGDSRTIKRLQ